MEHDGLYKPYGVRQRVVFIGEPVKLRPLTDSRNTIPVLRFSPYAKFLQGIIAHDRDQKNGLTGGHDCYGHLSRDSDFVWQNQPCLGARVDGSYFNNGERIGNLFNLFSDWSSATDRIDPECAAPHVRGISDVPNSWRKSLSLPEVDDGRRNAGAILAGMASCRPLRTINTPFSWFVPMGRRLSR